MRLGWRCPQHAFKSKRMKPVISLICIHIADRVLYWGLSVRRLRKKQRYVGLKLSHRRCRWISAMWICCDRACIRMLCGGWHASRSLLWCVAKIWAKVERHRWVFLAIFQSWWRTKNQFSTLPKRLFRVWSFILLADFVSRFYELIAWNCRWNGSFFVSLFENLVQLHIFPPSTKWNTSNQFAISSQSINALIYI